MLLSCYVTELLRVTKRTRRCHAQTTAEGSYNSISITVATFSGNMLVQRMSGYFLRFIGCVGNGIERSIKIL
jgi:hypothetical protein